MQSTGAGQLLRTESQVDRSSQSIFLVASIENAELKNKFLVPGIYLKAKLFGKKWGKGRVEMEHRKKGAGGDGYSKKWAR